MLMRCASSNTNIYVIIIGFVFKIMLAQANHVPFEAKENQLIEIRY